ncbi:SHOCT domain-containing protein [Mycobacterium sp. 236(2023)]|uniref:SHOCT domain-containing protein n=1 Tax=Mycobacterium sp. 236(2023) TaxID=3038163 RepID=UPI0024158159|nr:SHOCT domain-containing protein [Mycobacterium sp. 236(2023)]MDG4667089.1 SHOCT domain-containing protein [Mycobacterium sp. 236(2023)]
MTAAVTPEGEHAIADIARRHGLSRDAVLSMAVSVQNGGGTMAQFSIPELGGSGQWMRGGMTMVGDMFDHSLKARVDALCNELAQLLGTATVFAPTRNWWPADLGTPSSTGGQNDTRYAVFPATHRLAIHQRGATRVFDTGEHRIGGVQQQQAGAGVGGAGTVTFTSQLGTFDVSSLREIGAQQAAPSPASPAAAPPAPAPPSSSDPSSVIAAIESLAGLHERGILSDEEFAAKKAELLARI